MVTDIPQSIEQRQGKTAQHEGWTDWVAENVGKPMYNSGVVNTANVVANFVNGVTRHDLIGKLKPYELSAPDGMGESVTRTVAGGVAGVLPYAIAGKAANFGLRSLGGNLTGTMARIAASETTGYVLGAGIVDGLRDVNPGETRLGNIGSGMVAFGILGAGNHMTRDWSVAQRMLVGYPVVGAVGAEAQNISSSLLSGHAPSFDNVGSTMLGGAAMNSVLPWIHIGANRAHDALSVRAGRGVAVDHFAESNGLAGKSPALDAKLREYPLSKVKVETTGDGSRTELPNRAVTLDLAGERNVSGAERQTAIAQKLGHELEHIDLAKGAEPRFVEAQQLHEQSRQLQAQGQTESAGARLEEAHQHFLATRRGQELGARQFGQQIEAEFKGNGDTANGGKRNGAAEPLNASEKAFNTTEKLEPAYEARFENEWQRFAASNGAYRPNLEFFVPPAGYRLVTGAGGPKAYYTLGAVWRSSISASRSIATMVSVPAATLRPDWLTA